MFVTSMRSLLCVRIVIVVFFMLAVSACNQRAVKYGQVYSGANGPKQVGVQYFYSAVEVENSWIKVALNDAKYREILAGVDFSKQILLAFSSKEMDSFSGEIQLTDVYQYTGAKDLPINLHVRVGVLRDGCRNNIRSVPFVLAVIERPLGFQPVGGYDVAFFGDTCPKQ